MTDETNTELVTIWLARSDRLKLADLAQSRAIPVGDLATQALQQFAETPYMRAAAKIPHMCKEPFGTIMFQAPANLTAHYRERAAATLSSQFALMQQAVEASIQASEFSAFQP